MYDSNEIEKEILNFWKKNNIQSKLKSKNKGKKPFYFLQGPPYTSGYLHIGQAWNNALKDSVLRYKKMQGFDTWDRAGYDVHGIPTASKVQKKLNLKTKEEIEKFGVDKFIKECMNFSLSLVKVMNKDLVRLGVWMDLENAYIPLNEEWIESVWFLVKRAEEQKRLYEGEKTITWCPHCATAIAKHECDYKEVPDESIYVKFKVKGKENEYLLIWTTTPWTIPFNLAIMVNPDLGYARTKVGDEVWIIAKELADLVIKQKIKRDYSIISEMKGSELEHLEYEHPFEDTIPDYKELKKEHPKVHTVILSKEYVHLKDGTGLVHCAPGCGPEDYEVGHKNHIPPYNKINEEGKFEGLSKFNNWVAKENDDRFIKELDDKGALLFKEKITHDYAHCDRCKTPVVFRTTKQWFFKIEDLKEQMLKFNKKIYWVPQSINNSYTAWLENLRDNSITKQRYWGTPIPVWRCESCGDYTVISTKKELIKLSKKTPKNLHRPWIDKITIPCKCGKVKKRIPDILDVWIDAGVACWGSLYYPQKENYLKKLYPPDFILEGRDQVRGWFNLLMIASVLAFNKMPFKNIYVHGMITDIEGEKMSKSLGNIISPVEVITKFGADTFRFYIFRTNAGEDVRFSWEEVESKHRNLSILWNINQYLLDYSKASKIDPTKKYSGKLDIEEKYILSRLNSTIKKVTELYNSYKLDQIPVEIEKLFLDLSRSYIQSTREKVSENPKLVLSTIYKVLFETIKMLSTISPFLTEKIYQNLKQEFKLEKESITLFSWPKSNDKLIDKRLEEEIELAEKIIQAGLSAREKAKVGVRWPLPQIKVISRSNLIAKTIKSLETLLKSKLNVKKIGLKKESKDIKLEIFPNISKIGRDFKKDSVTIIKKLNFNLLKELNEKGKLKIGNFELDESHIKIKEVVQEGVEILDFGEGKLILDTRITPGLEKEGFTREVIRRVQQMRKDIGLKKENKIELSIVSDYSLKEWKDEIQKTTNSKLVFEDKKYRESKEFDIKEKKFKISIKEI